MPEPGIGRPDERVAAAQAAMTSSGSVPAGAAQYIGGSDTTDVITQLRDPIMRGLQEQYAATGGLEDILSKEEFFAQNNMTLTNPYGVSRFGLDPSRIDFSDNISEKNRRAIMDLAYDRYRNPLLKRTYLEMMLGET